MTFWTCCFCFESVDVYFFAFIADTVADGCDVGDIIVQGLPIARAVIGIIDTDFSTPCTHWNDTFECIEVIQCPAQF